MDTKSTTERDTFVELDPVRLNIQNRLDASATSRGHLELNSGLMLQGTHVGDLTVRGGPLVISEGGCVRGGRVTVEGDMFVFGQIGAENDAEQPTVVECAGEMHLTVSSVSYGGLRCARPAVYAGAKIKGVLDTGE